MGSDKDKLDKLSERIRKAEAENNPAPKATPSPMRNAGFDFAGSILGGAVMGVLLDRFFGTSPWLLVTMVVLGFATGVFGIWRMMQSRDKE